MDWPSVHSVSLTKTLGLALVSLQLLRVLEKGWICLLLQCFVLLLSFRHKTARYSQYSKPDSHYGANFVPIFIKQIQCFEKIKKKTRTRLSNKSKVICKFKTQFKRKCRGMDKYMHCVLQLWYPFAFLCGNLAWFSHTCNWAAFFSKNSRWRCASIYASLPKHLFTSSEQCEWEQVSFYLTISIINPFRCFHKATLLQCQWNSQQVL